MVIDFNRLNNAATPASTGRTGSTQSGNVNESSAQKQAAATPAPAAPASKSGESVELSREAQQLQKLSEKLGDLPSVNKERVAQLKQAIADGNFTLLTKNAETLMRSIRSGRE